MGNYSSSTGENESVGSEKDSVNTPRLTRSKSTEKMLSTEAHLNDGIGMDSSHGLLKRVYVTVPKGVRSGQYFTVHINGQDLEIRCPPAYSRISDRIVVELPIDSNPALVAENLSNIGKRTGAAVNNKADSCSSKSDHIGKKRSGPDRVYVSIPKGVRCGQYFSVNVRGHDLMVRCPPAYSRISDRVLVELPAEGPSAAKEWVGPDEASEAVYRIAPADANGISNDDFDGGKNGVQRQRSFSFHSAKPAHTNLSPYKQPHVESKPVRTYVTIPKGVRSGQYFTVHVRGHDLKVRCPPAYSRISDRVLVELPAEEPVSSNCEAGESPVGNKGARSVQSAPDQLNRIESADMEGSELTSALLGSRGTQVVSSSSTGRNESHTPLLKDSE